MPRTPAQKKMPALDGVEEYGRQATHSPYLEFDRQEWSRLRADTPLPLDEAEVPLLSGQNEPVSVEEVVEIYLPLSRLLNLYVRATQNLHQAATTFLGKPAVKTPYVIGMAGSVAVGKSTTARILRALLSRWPHHPRVALVTTDGWLFPNRTLEERGLMPRKGFPESFDVQGLVRFLADVKAGRRRLKIPVYSHHSYDIVPRRFDTVDRPDILIIEGLNVLQTGTAANWRKSRIFVSDFFDFTLYIDSETKMIREWFIDRFMTFRNLATNDPTAFFHRFSRLSEEEVRDYAARIWSDINEVNLVENILPTKWRADLVLSKDDDHAVRRIYLRKL